MFNVVIITMSPIDIESLFHLHIVSSGCSSNAGKNNDLPDALTDIDLDLTFLGAAYPVF